MNACVWACAHECRCLQRSEVSDPLQLELQGWCATQHGCWKLNSSFIRGVFKQRIPTDAAVTEASGMSHCNSTALKAAILVQSSELGDNCCPSHPVCLWDLSKSALLASTQAEETYLPVSPPTHQC